MEAASSDCSSSVGVIGWSSVGSTGWVSVVISCGLVEGLSGRGSNEKLPLSASSSKVSYLRFGFKSGIRPSMFSLCDPNPNKTP